MLPSVSAITKLTVIDLYPSYEKSSTLSINWGTVLTSNKDFNSLTEVSPGTMFAHLREYFGGLAIEATLPPNKIPALN